MRLEVDLRQDDYAAPTERLEALGRAVAEAELGGAEVEVSLVLTGDSEIAELNERYLGHAGPTDVISFPQFELRPGELVELPFGAPLGDIVVSVDTAARQAAEFAGWTTDDEVALLFVHGLLHLCGYDDLTAGDRAVMQARETALLTAAGSPPPPRNEDADETLPLA